MKTVNIELPVWKYFMASSGRFSPDLDFSKPSSLEDLVWPSLAQIWRWSAFHEKNCQVSSLQSSLTQGLGWSAFNEQKNSIYRLDSLTSARPGAGNEEKKF